MPPSSARPRSPRRSSAPTSRPTRCSTSSWARSSRPARARSPRARPRSRPGSPRRSPARPSTRCAPRACAPRSCSTRRSARATSRSASAAAWSRCRGALPAAPGALRLPHGRRQGARRDGPRRPHQPLQRAPDVRRGDRGRRRARAHAPRPRPLGAALARARDRRDRRGPPARGDRRRSRSRVARATPSSRSTRARGATRASRRSPSCPASWARRARTRPATRRASTTAAARSCWPATSGPRPTARRSSPRSSPTPQSANDFAYLATHAGARGREGAGQGRALGRGHRPVGDQRGLRLGALHSIRMLGIDEDRVNVNGGAVALGHPIGASGARILGALVHELRRRGGGLGCAAICSGGGQGDAVILKVHATGRDARRHPSGGGRPGPGRARAGRRLLRPRPHADGRLVRPVLGARGARRGPAHPPADRALRLGERQVPPARLDRPGDRPRAPRGRRDDLRPARGRPAAAGAQGAGRRAAARCTRRCSRSPTPTRTPAARSTSAPPPRRRWPRCSPTC